MYEYLYEYEVVHEWLLYIVAFAASFGIALFLTPWARKVSFKLGAVDKPKARGMHNKPMPRLGGLAIVLGFMATMGILAFFMPELRTLQFAGFAVGALIIVGLGMLDDIYNLKARVKLFVQIGAAVVVVFTGTRIDFIGWNLPEIFDTLSVPITILWIVGIVNAVNFVDGVDGLAAGVSSIAAVFLTILCIMTGSPLAVVFAATLAGSSLGFLPRNFSPAEVYMGDTGATFIGYVLAVSSIIGVYKSYALLSVLIVGFALALPIMDTVYVMVCRILKRKSPMTADRGHLHHKLIDRGYSHKQTVVILYVVSIFAGAIAILIALENINALIIGLVALLVLFSIIYVYRKRVDQDEE
ncbi:MAG: undecaprenyl/decaprenyl-phosphate alpha-N-acetylglucosaminyl 1-phosphate transferase [Clostridiales bacterium]|jgi:UDP-GlcNAc:undecaprenyl-phosphate GlcNAc-1-phosphate transferase|nr:undecaprenyl/decaprenyl-phosphate alpha-N-acetylglucosaminyl 1-phosphate transferase [Clostridiales bacterium]